MSAVRLLPLLLVLALLSACNQPSAQPDQATTGPVAPAEQPAATASGAYPGPSSAYPGPNSAAYPGGESEGGVPTADANPIVVPQPASDQVGVVTGAMFRIEGEQRVPVAGAILYLGTLLQNSEGVDAMVQLDRLNGPSTVTNSLGQFLFTDLPPERYGLWFDAIEGVLLLNDPESGGDFIIEVTGGEVVDLGDLAYPLPDLE
jgi:hypothetical protein